MVRGCTKTGDRVRTLRSGELEFLGRTDFQVKIQGFPIELGEIEAALLAQPSVREALVKRQAEAKGLLCQLPYAPTLKEAEKAKRRSNAGAVPRGPPRGRNLGP